MGGSLDGSTKREIRLPNVTGFNTTQIENEFNNNWGPLGWRIVQVVVIGSNQFLLVEREI